MAEPSSTIGDLVKAKAIAAEEVEAATRGLFVNPTMGTFRISTSYRLDLAAALQAHLPSATALFDPGRAERLKLTAARTAIILAGTEKT